MTPTEQLLLDTLREHGEMDRHRLYDAASRARKKAGARNSIHYHHFQGAIRKLVDNALIVHRYAPSQYDDDRRKFGHDFYRVAE